jgi:hypothetical protein
MGESGIDGQLLDLVNAAIDDRDRKLRSGGFDHQKWVRAWTEEISSRDFNLLVNWFGMYNKTCNPYSFDLNKPFPGNWGYLVELDATLRNTCSIIVLLEFMEERWPSYDVRDAAQRRCHCLKLEDELEKLTCLSKLQVDLTGQSNNIEWLRRLDSETRRCMPASWPNDSTNSELDEDESQESQDDSE